MKTSIPAVKNTLVIPGQPSADLLAKLTVIGEKLSDRQIGECYARVESQRRRFMADVVRLGVMLLAKKQATPHGKWESWVTTMTKTAEPALLALPVVLQEKSVRSCRVYMQVGKHFLADAEQGTFRAAAKDAVAPTLACTASDVALLPELSKTRQSEIEQAIDSFINDRPLDRMLIDFRRAENAADQEETDEANRRRKKPGAADPAQLDFWDEINRPLTEIDTLMKSPDFIERTTKQGWLKLADELTAKAREARAIAAKIL